MGAIAPAMGLIGSVIGLVQMLEHLDDPAKIGPGMATALLTTFYGAMLAYLIFIPLSGKLRAKSEADLHIKEMSIEGVLCILQDLNPRLIEQRLFSFLPTEARLSQFE
jgi:chemotaxis protein MotA